MKEKNEELKIAFNLMAKAKKNLSKGNKQEKDKKYSLILVESIF